MDDNILCPAMATLSLREKPLIGNRMNREEKWIFVIYELFEQQPQTLGLELRWFVSIPRKDKKSNKDMN